MLRCWNRWFCARPLAENTNFSCSCHSYTNLQRDGAMLPKSASCSVRVIRYFVHFVFVFPHLEELNTNYTKRRSSRIFLVHAIRIRIGGLEKHQAALQRRGHAYKKRLVLCSCHLIFRAFRVCFSPFSRSCHSYTHRRLGKAPSRPTNTGSCFQKAPCVPFVSFDFSCISCLLFRFFSFVPFVNASAAWKSTKPPYKDGAMFPKSALRSFRAIRNP